MKLKVEVEHVVRTAPRGYGVAYHNFQRGIAICYPIPLNLLIGVLRRLYWRVMDGVKPARRERYEDRIISLTEEVLAQNKELRKLRTAVKEMRQESYTWGQLKDSIGYDPDWEEENKEK